MNNQQPAVLENEITDISSMLLPVQEGYLLLPGVSVAEIVSYQPAQQDEDNPPNWYLGNIKWRNLDVPLACYETLRGKGEPQLGHHCRIAVLNNSGLNQQLDFFAIVIQGTPRLLRVTPAEIIENEEREVEDGERMHVLVAGEEALIPNLQLIEKAIIDYFEFI